MYIMRQGRAMVYYFLRLSQTILQQDLNLSLIAQKGRDGLFGGVSQRDCMPS